MCIRDRAGVDHQQRSLAGRQRAADLVGEVDVPRRIDQVEVCLLYTSDAADERSSVDLGGRRII